LHHSLGDFLSASDATANLLRHSLTENLLSVSMSSCDTPITVAPMAFELVGGLGKLVCLDGTAFGKGGRIKIQHHRPVLEAHRPRKT